MISTVPFAATFRSRTASPAKAAAVKTRIVAIPGRKLRRKNCINLRFARDPAGLDQTLPDTLLPFLSWTPVVLKAFDEIVHRFAARETRLYIEQRHDNTTEGQEDDLQRQPEDLNGRFEHD